MRPSQRQLQRNARCNSKRKRGLASRCAATWHSLVIAACSASLCSLEHRGLTPTSKVRKRMFLRTPCLHIGIQARANHKIFIATAQGGRRLEPCGALTRSKASRPLSPMWLWLRLSCCRLGLASSACETRLLTQSQATAAFIGTDMEAQLKVSGF